MQTGEIERASGSGARFRQRSKRNSTRCSRKQPLAQNNRSAARRPDAHENPPRHRQATKAHQRNPLRHQGGHHGLRVEASARPHPTRHTSNHGHLQGVRSLDPIPVPLAPAFAPQATRAQLRCAQRSRPRSAIHRTACAAEPHALARGTDHATHSSVTGNAMLHPSVFRRRSQKRHGGQDRAAPLRR